MVFPSADGTDNPPHSNLGGAGPDGGAEELRYYHAGVWNDRPFDVVVTTTTPGYAPVDASATGLVAEEGGQMGQISLPADGSSPLERVRRQGYSGQLVGENISESYENDIQTLNAWMQTRDTRDVIMDPTATSLGFAWYQEPSGKIWWTLISGT